MMAGADSGESTGARSARSEERHLQVAATLGDHGARITALEADKADTNNQLREIRGILQRIESARAQGAASPTVELLMNRVLDVLANPKPPLPQPSAGELVTAIAQAMGAKRSTDPLAVIGWALGAGVLAWIARGLILGG